jgi:hypothetical protein
MLRGLTMLLPSNSTESSPKPIFKGDPRMKNKPATDQMRPHEMARIENALLELFAAFGHNLNSIQNSLQANHADGLISTEIVLPGMSVLGVQLAIDPARPLSKGMYVKCKDRDAHALQKSTPDQHPDA